MKKSFWSFLAAAAVSAVLIATPSALAAKKKTPTPTPAAADTKSDKVEKVNLNTADEKTIAGAKGVGAKLAKELVKNRPYRTWEEVSKVKGVGSGKKLDSLRKVLKLTEGVPAAADDKAPKEKAAKPTKTPKATKTATSDSGAATSGGSSSSSSSSTGSSSSSSSGAATSESPKKSSSSSASSSKSGSSSTPKLAAGETININTASAEELEKLPGIGPVKSKAIVDYRDANGKFGAIEDIMKVSGIKEGTFAKIKDSITVR